MSAGLRRSLAVGVGGGLAAAAYAAYGPGNPYLPETGVWGALKAFALVLSAFAEPTVLDADWWLSAGLLGVALYAAHRGGSRPTAPVEVVEPIEPDGYTSGEPMLLAGLRRHHAFADAPAGIQEQWADFRALGPIPDRVEGPEGRVHYGVICGTDGERLEYLSGVEVTRFDGLPEGLGRMKVPPSYYAVFRHDGPADTLQARWQRVFKWLDADRFSSAHTPDFERYGPGFDAATGTGDIEIRVAVQPHPTPTI